MKRAKVRQTIRSKVESNDFFDASGVDLGKRAQSSMQCRDELEHREENPQGNDLKHARQG